MRTLTVFILCVKTYQLLVSTQLGRSAHGPGPQPRSGRIVDTAAARAMPFMCMLTILCAFHYFMKLKKCRSEIPYNMVPPGNS